jgi:prepilin-type N-terminal cleavage/methylation domain-containing protein
MSWMCKTARQLRDEEAGFTLPELLVTMLIMTTVMFALYSIFDMSLRVFSFGNDKTEAVENARLGLERMEREIRTAYPYNKLDADAANDNILYGVSPSTTVSPNPSNSITFFNDLNGNYTEDASERITYSLSGGSPPALLRNGESLVEFVQPGGLSFTYCKSVDACNPSSPPSVLEREVKLVSIELTIAVDRGVSGTATQTLTTDVKLRNRIR